jgi:hypothetical protein
LLTLAIVSLAFVGVSAKQSHHSRRLGANGDHLRAKMVEKVNSMKTTWTAGLNKRFAGKPIDAIKRQLGVLDVNPPPHKRPAVKGQNEKNTQ